MAASNGGVFNPSGSISRSGLVKFLSRPKQSTSDEWMAASVPLNVTFPNAALMCPHQAQVELHGFNELQGPRLLHPHLLTCRQTPGQAVLRIPPELRKVWSTPALQIGKRIELPQTVAWSGALPNRHYPPSVPAAASQGSKWAWLPSVIELLTQLLPKVWLPLQSTNEHLMMRQVNEVKHACAHACF